MSTCRKSRDIETKKALVMLRLLIQKLQRGLSVLAPRGPEDLREVRVLAATTVLDDASKDIFFFLKKSQSYIGSVELMYM